MKATREKGSRTINLTGLPPTVGDLKNLPTSLVICVNYSTADPSSTLDKAICLDHVVVPAIIAALNYSFPRRRKENHS